MIIGITLIKVRHCKTRNVISVMILSRINNGNHCDIRAIRVIIGSKSNNVNNRSVTSETIVFFWDFVIMCHNSQTFVKAIMTIIMS